MKDNKMYQFQGLRAIAFCGIFISHVGVPRTGTLGAWGVSIFFVLSGFIMTCSYWNRDLIYNNLSLKFSISKIKKLYLLHIFTMFGCLLIEFYNFFAGKQSILKIIIDVLLHSTLLQIWIPNAKYYNTLNGVSWYLCVCVLLYTCFPAILIRMKKIVVKTKIVFYICLMFGLQIIVSIIANNFCAIDSNALLSAQWLTYYCPLVRLIDFIIGCLLGCLYNNKKEETIVIKKAKLYIIEIVLGILVCISWLIYATKYSVLGSESVRYTILFTPTTILIIWILANYKGIIYNILSLKILIKLGDVSAYTFLIHSVVIKYLRKILSYLSLNNIGFLMLFSILGTALITYVWIKMESKLINKTKKYEVQRYH